MRVELEQCSADSIELSRSIKHADLVSKQLLVEEKKLAFVARAELTAKPGRTVARTPGFRCKLSPGYIYALLATVSSLLSVLPLHADSQSTWYKQILHGDLRDDRRSRTPG